MTKITSNLIPRQGRVLFGLGLASRPLRDVRSPGFDPRGGSYFIAVAPTTASEFYSSQVQGLNPNQTGIADPADP